MKVESVNSCYKVFSTEGEERSVADSYQHCQEQHPKAKLVSIQGEEEQTALKKILQLEPRKSIFMATFHSCQKKKESFLLKQYEIGQEHQSINANDTFISEMLEGWQGWWTSGKYNDAVNFFQWEKGQAIVENWGFQREPFVDTCVWVLQISVYNYTYGNYDCGTMSGHICEIELPTF